jgi:hypothetical protein
VARGVRSHRSRLLSGHELYLLKDPIGARAVALVNADRACRCDAGRARGAV